MSCTSNSLRKKALKDDLGHEDLLKTARASERSERQATLMEKSNDIHKITHEEAKHHFSKPRKGPNKFGKYSNKGRQNRERTNTRSSSRKCFNCGESWPHPDGKT